MKLLSLASPSSHNFIVRSRPISVALSALLLAAVSCAYSIAPICCTHVASGDMKLPFGKRKTAHNDEEYGHGHESPDAQLGKPATAKGRTCEFCLASRVAH